MPKGHNHWSSYSFNGKNVLILLRSNLFGIQLSLNGTTFKSDICSRKKMTYNEESLKAIWSFTRYFKRSQAFFYFFKGSNFQTQKEVKYMLPGAALARMSYFRSTRMSQIRSTRMSQIHSTRMSQIHSTRMSQIRSTRTSQIKEIF